ncbi:zinc finger, CCHC-type containing protein [Tanacetum coccineum]
MDARSDVYVFSNGCRKSSDNINNYYWSMHQTLLEGHSILSLEGGLSGDCDVEKNAKWSYAYTVGSQEYHGVCTRPDIASADVGMLDGFDRGLQTYVHGFMDFDYTMGRLITGYGLMIHGCAVSWEAILLHMEALSATGVAYMTLTEVVKEDILLKGFSIESGVELRSLAGIVTGALTKPVPGSRFQHRHLKKEMPSMMGKAKAQQKLIDNLEDVFAKVQREHRLPAGDFPYVKKTSRRDWAATVLTTSKN